MKVILIAAISVDGYIARRDDELIDWTSKEDKKLFVELTKQAGVVVMGSKTFRTIGKALPGRHTIVYSRQELHEPNVELTQERPDQLIARLKRVDIAQTIAICGGRRVYDMFLKTDVVDELYLTIEPVVFGQGIHLADSPLNVPLRLIDHELLNESSVTLHYEVLR
jgi:dihydrofolate reductase